MRLQTILLAAVAVFSAGAAQAASVEVRDAVARVTVVPGDRTDIKVEVITPATSATFSMLPTSNASGNFTKVTQLVPVRVSVNLGNRPLLLGANVEVKIRVAD